MYGNFEYEVEVEIDDNDSYDIEVEYDDDYDGHGQEIEIEIEIEEPTVEYEYENTYGGQGNHNYQSWGQKDTEHKLQWNGWFRQGGVKNNMIFQDFQVGFDGTIWGSGYDQVGQFNIFGKKNPQGFLTFNKQYIGQHCVIYKGKAKDQSITGKWEIPGNCAGDFQINWKAPIWTGTFWQGGMANQMRLVMDFQGNQVHGRGSDEVGTYLIRGNNDGYNVNFAKQYWGAHTVMYSGHWQNNQIVGHWNIPGNDNGKFNLRRSN